MAWGDAMPQDGSRTGYRLLLCVGAGESGRDPITEVFMSTDDQVTQPPWRASEKVWKGLGLIATGTAGPAGLYGCSCCILELRDRVKALEAAAKTAALLVPKEGPALVLSEDAFQALEAAGGRAPDAPAGGGLTVEQLAECLPINALQGPEGYSRRFFAEHLLSHPIAGPLLRGEGAGAPRRMVLAETPPFPAFPRMLGTAGYFDGFREAWAAARAEVERQQQGGQADG